MAINKTVNTRINEDPQNRDPISGETGAHPIGTALGAGAAASAGAALGAVAGPVGSAAGAVVGAIAGGIFGGLAGSGIAELVNPTQEIEYWRENYSSRPYVNQGANFETYKPAYEYGYKSRAENPDRSFDQVRDELQSNWQTNKTNLDWTQAEPAIRDSYERTGNQYKQRLEDNMANKNASNNSGAANASSNSADSASRPGAPDANASGYAAGKSGAFGSANTQNPNKNNSAA